MKVYIVEEIDYEESIVHGVFSTQKKADQYVESGPQSEIHSGKPRYLDVQEFDVDMLQR